MVFTIIGDPLWPEFVSIVCLMALFYIETIDPVAEYWSSPFLVIRSAGKPAISALLLLIN